MSFDMKETSMKQRMMMIVLLLGSALLLNGCSDGLNSSSELEMIYIKSVSLYDRICCGEVHRVNTVKLPSD
jgi:hypothetical protein